MTGNSKDLTGAGPAQPESLAEFDAAARKGGVKPANLGTTADAETGPRPDDPRQKDETATRVLQAGVDKDPSAATRAAQSRKDPRTGH
jgi:hypothetical protein